MAKLVEIIGKTLSGEWGKDDVDGTGIPVLRTTNFTNEGLVNFENVVTRIITKKNIEEKYLKYGDIIIEKSGGSDKQPVGRVVFFDGPEHKYLFNNFTGLLRIKDKGKWEPKYVFYSLFSNYRKGGTKVFENKTTGLHNLKIDDYVSRYEIKNIAIKEQRTICEKLDTIRRIITLQEELLLKFDTLIKARFVEIFGDPALNPLGWEQSRLKEIGIGKLSYGSGASACEYNGNIRYIRITDIDDEGGLNTDIVSPNVVDEKYILNDGDILFARSGATVGKTYRYREDDGECLYAGYLIRLIPDQSKVLPDYVFYFTKTNYYENFIAANRKVVAQPNINAQQYGDLLICIPPMNRQKKFIEFVRQVDKSKVVVQKSMDKTQLLFDSLMQKYFN